MKWGVVVAAGGEAPRDIATAIGAPTKALARFGDATSLELVHDAVRMAGLQTCATVGGEPVRPFVNHGEWVREVGSAIDNVMAGLAALGEVDGVLMLPADAPALTAAEIRRFVDATGDPNAGRWYAAGLSPAGEFSARYPDVPTKAIRLREGRFLSGALYAASPEGLRHGQELFRHARRNRKSQLALAARFGFLNMARYFSGGMTLAMAERALGRTLAGSVQIDLGCDPSTCLDFDDAHEYRALARILGARVVSH